MKLRPTAPSRASSRAKPTSPKQSDQSAGPPDARRRRRLVINDDASTPPIAKSGRHALAAPPVDAPRAGPSRLQFQLVPIDAMKPAARKLREHDDAQITMLTGSIERFGFNVPVLLTRDYEIVAGDARIEAARRLGMTELPAVFISDLSGAAVEAFRIADNKLAQLGKWNETALREALKVLMQLDFEPQDLGFLTLEIDIFLQEPQQPEDLDGAAVDQKRYSVILGDIFVLGHHRVMCGNALEARDVAQLMGEDTAAMAFLDAPYNVPIAGNVTKSRDCAEFAMGSGEMSTPVFIDFLADAHARVLAVMAPGGLIYSCMDHRGIGKLLAAAERIGLEYLNLAVWKKNKAGMGSFYRSAHELIGVFRAPGAQHTNNVMLGKHGRNRTNVWEYRTPILNAKDTDPAIAEHGTPKPWDMIADAIKDCTRRGDIVIDVFGGSGATLVGAEKTGRTARVMEIDPRYVSNMLARYERLFGEPAVHVASGLTAFELTLQRQEA